MAKDLIDKYLIKTRQESKELEEWKKTVLNFLDKYFTHNLKNQLSLELTSFTVL
jgi:hypothetical protein